MLIMLKRMQKNVDKEVDIRGESIVAATLRTAELTRLFQLLIHVVWWFFVCPHRLRRGTNPWWCGTWLQRWAWLHKVLLQREGATMGLRQVRCSANLPAFWKSVSFCHIVWHAPPHCCLLSVRFWSQQWGRQRKAVVCGASGKDWRLRSTAH